MENALLRDYDYAWNKRLNGGDDGLRLDSVLPRDSEDSEDSEESEDGDDSDDAENTCILN